MPLLIQKCTIADLEAHQNFVDLVEQYAQECAIDGMPHPSGKLELYKMLEQSGFQDAFQVTVDGLLIGFAVVLCVTSPHYGVQVATTETIFVTKAERGLAGGRLIQRCLGVVDERKAPGILISAPKDSDLAAVLENSEDFVETNRVFFWKAKVYA